MDQTQLQRFLQDALSAAAGWTVVPPEARCIGPAGGERANWALDVGGMDDASRQLVAWFQDRYDLEPSARPNGAAPGRVLAAFLAWDGRTARAPLRCPRPARRRLRAFPAMD